MADSNASTSAPTGLPPNGEDHQHQVQLPHLEAPRNGDPPGRDDVKINVPPLPSSQETDASGLAAREAAPETPLHVAVRQRRKNAIVDNLREFVHKRDIHGMPPLYLAIFLGYSDIAERLITTFGNTLSYDGPDGQNVLHVAALRSKDLTQSVLHAQSDLRNGADGRRSTPLHFAASVGLKGVTRLLLQADTTGDMREAADSNGMRPIHVAASVGAMDAVRALVGGNDHPTVASRDNKGRTFLHVAVENKKADVVKFACREPTFKDYLVRLLGGERRPTFRNILNMEDDEGNTALHLAVKSRDESIFGHLVGNRNVDLNRVNKDGYTPLDLACKIKTENSFASRYQQNPTQWMIRVLAHSGAYFTARRRDLKFVRVTENDQHQAKFGGGDGVARTAATTQSNKQQADVALATESVLVASALIATLTFAAAFTVPGSYKTDGHPKAGTPALGGHYGFKVFIVADVLAFFCSVAATFSLAEYANRGGVDPLVRRVYAQRAVWLFHVALRSVIVAFALGVIVVMWDISVVTTIIVIIATCAIVLYGNEALAHDVRLVRVMYRRFGFLRSGKLHPSTSSRLDWGTWRLRSFYATIFWNIVKLVWTYGVIILVAYFAQLKQKDGN